MARKKTVQLGEVVFVVEPTFDSDGVQASAGIDVQGREHPDPVPMEPPVGYKPPPDIIEMIRRVVRDETVRAQLEAQDMETFEEAEDFDIEDDPLDALTPYERVFEPPPKASEASAAEVSVSRPVVSPDPSGSTPSDTGNKDSSSQLDLARKDQSSER